VGADLPGAPALLGEHLLADGDLFGSTGLVGQALAAVVVPGGGVELQAAVVVAIEPLPVLVFQSPPLSQAAILSQLRLSQLRGGVAVSPGVAVGATFAASSGGVGAWRAA
jgi:hypothetical protein